MEICGCHENINTMLSNIHSNKLISAKIFSYWISWTNSHSHTEKHNAACNGNKAITGNSFCGSLCATGGYIKVAFEGWKVRGNETAACNKTLNSGQLLTFHQVTNSSHSTHEISLQRSVCVSMAQSELKSDLTGDMTCCIRDILQLSANTAITIHQTYNCRTASNNQLASEALLAVCMINPHTTINLTANDILTVS